MIIVTTFQGWRLARGLKKTSGLIYYIVKPNFNMQLFVNVGDLTTVSGIHPLLFWFSFLPGYWYVITYASLIEWSTIHEQHTYTLIK